MLLRQPWFESYLAMKLNEPHSLMSNLHLLGHEAIKWGDPNAY